MSEVAAAAPAKTSRWEDLLDVFLEPHALFARRANETWWKPFGLLVAICVILYYAFISANGEIIRATMMQKGATGASAAQVEQGAAIAKWAGGIGMPFGLAFVMLFTAIGLKLGTWMFEPNASWRQAFTIAVYSMFVAIPQQILTAIAVMIRSRFGEVTMRDTSFGVMRFVDPDSLNAVTTALLSRLDLFAIWSAVLCAIGLMVVVKMPRNRAFAAAAFAWLLISIPALLGAMASGAGR
jgi:hypothetical protein